MQRALAFIKKDFQISSSYKPIVVIHWIGISLTLTTFYFLAKFIDKGEIRSLYGYSGGGYFPFVLLGLIMSNYLPPS